MVLPLYKVLSLVIRVFSKPLITYTKQAHLKNDASGSNPIIRKAFVWLGNSYHRGETWVNRKFMKIETQFAYKPLNDELAIEKGIEFFYELIFYSLMIGLPLYEMIRGAEEAKEKSKALEEKLKRIDEQLKLIREKEEEHKRLDESIASIPEESGLKTEATVFGSNKEIDPLIKEYTSCETQTESISLSEKVPISNPLFQCPITITKTLPAEKLEEVSKRNKHLHTLQLNIDGKIHKYHFFLEANEERSSLII